MQRISKHILMSIGLLCLVLAHNAAFSAATSSVPPYNIILIINDQETYHLLPARVSITCSTIASAAWRYFPQSLHRRSHVLTFTCRIFNR